MTFYDGSGQLYGRYVINESVPDLAYSQKQVTERIWVPKTVTESKTVTQVQYTPVYSYQPQLRNTSSWNPFVPPKQEWQYVPIVQYQPSYTQVVQPVQYQQYEEKEVVKIIPELNVQARQVGRFVDRPLTHVPSGGNFVANNYNWNAGAPITGAPITGGPINPYQQAALTAQANRNSYPALPTRPIDYPNASANSTMVPTRNLVAQAPVPYYPPIPNSAANTPSFTNPATFSASTNPAAGGIPGNSNTYAYNTVLPATAMQPTVPSGSNSMYGYPNGYVAPNPAYASTASRPVFPWTNLVNGTGSLFGSSAIAPKSAPSYVASNTPMNQPNVSGNSNPYGGGFRPVSSPYVAPPPAWGVSPGVNYRDPMQGGMPATELR